MNVSVDELRYNLPITLRDLFENFLESFENSLQFLFIFFRTRERLKNINHQKPEAGSSDVR